MAEVHIVDIDGEQWAIKDQKAENDIKTLSEGLPTKLENIFTGNYVENGFVIPNTGEFVTAPKTGILTGSLVKTPNNTSNVSIAEENTLICTTDMATANAYWNNFIILIRKGKRYRLIKNQDNDAHLDYLQFLPFNFD